ncbi:MAG: AraC family transcriptional regulator [Firmicutes bacterium]|jgi:DNA-directed RNA polymerase subunit delta|nr:AraC family transcriptional regulator [Bacillota bacterium]
MDDLTSRVAYLRGLAAGLGIEESSREGKLFTEIIDVIDALAVAVTELQEDHAELADYTEAIDEDLNELEDDFYESYGEEEDEDYYDLEAEDDDMFSVECPECHEIVYIDDDMLEDDDVVEILCPNCERIVFVNDDKSFDDFDAFPEDTEEGD